MTTIFTKATLALALGATALTVAAPAEAQRYGGHRDHDSAGPAIIAGIAGLVIGAAIFSGSRNHRHDERRDPRYDAQGGYYVDGNGYPDQQYRNDPYRNQRGYDDQRGYRGNDYGSGYSGYGDNRGGGRCYVENRWDRYSGQQVMVRICQ